VSDRRFTRALVTGASSGIGAAIAAELAGRGTDLVLVARNEEKLQTLATELSVAHGIEVEVLPADLTETEALATVEDRLRGPGAPVDLLVNNAGIGQVGRFEELDIDTAQRQIALNVIAPLRLSHAALPNLKTAGGGILNVSSIAANQPVPHMATYAASKAFLTSWTEALHEELRGTPVHVTVLAPGFTHTGFVGAAEADRAASRIPSLVWSDAVAVARAGVDGVTARRAVVTPGPLYRLSGAMSSATPSVITRRVIGTVIRQLGN
jgi:short-subunit dehydrogenase